MKYCCPIKCDIGVFISAGVKGVARVLSNQTLAQCASNNDDDILCLERLICEHHDSRGRRWDDEDVRRVTMVTFNGC